jgi:hypothetical protein
MSEEMTDRPRLPRIARFLKDRFFLGRAEAIVRSYAPEQQAHIRQLYDAAANRLALADESTDGWYAPAAVTLHRESIRFLASAIVIAQDPSPPGPPLDLRAALAKIEELVRLGALPALPRRYAAARSILETPDHLTFFDQDAIEAARGRAAVESLVQWLRRRVEPRNIRQIWLGRGLRALLAAAAVLALIRLLIRLTTRHH